MNSPLRFLWLGEALAEEEHASRRAALLASCVAGAHCPALWNKRQPTVGAQRRSASIACQLITCSIDKTVKVWDLVEALQTAATRRARTPPEPHAAPHGFDNTAAARRGRIDRHHLVSAGAALAEQCVWRDSLGAPRAIRREADHGRRATARAAARLRPPMPPPPPPRPPSARTRSVPRGSALCSTRSTAWRLKREAHRSRAPSRSRWRRERPNAR